MIFDPNNYPFGIIVIAAIVGAIAIISRPFSTYVKFVYPNAKFEAMGNPFIGDKELDSVAESKDIISFKETINTLKDYNISGEDTYSVQKSLDDTFIETVNMMRNDSSKKMNDFYDVYLEKLATTILLFKNENSYIGELLWTYSCSLRRNKLDCFFYRGYYERSFDGCRAYYSMFVWK